LRRARRRLYLRSWQPRTATDRTRHRGARSVASASARARRGFAGVSPRCTWSASRDRAASTKGGSHHGRIDRRAGGADRRPDLRAPAVCWLYGRKVGAGQRRRAVLPRRHRANRRGEPRPRSLPELRQLHDDVFARPPGLRRVSAARAEDVRLAVRQILERQIQECADCLRRTLATVFRPDAPAAR
jgi:hypothetical protein